MTRFDRRLVAGEGERGGGARDRRSGDHLGGGDHGRGASACPRHLEQAGETGVAGARRKRARGGGQSSGSCGCGLQSTGRQERRGNRRGGSQRIGGRRWRARGRLESAGRRWGSTAAGGEDGDGDGSTGRSGLRGSAESFRARRRSSCACRRGEGEAVVAAMASGSDDSVWWCSRERERGGDERG